MNLDFMGMGGQLQQSNTPPNLKEIFKNNDITIFSSLNQNENVYNGSFYISNNTSSQINDIVVNFLVKNIYLAKCIQLLEKIYLQMLR